MNKVSVIILEKRREANKEKIRKIIFKILKILKKKNLEMEIYLINSKKMRFLNKKFRGQNKTTSVLSFEEPRNFISPLSRFKRIGEIYLDSELSDFSLQAPNLLIHGLLHLLGYDHKKKNDRIKMERKEKILIKLI